MFYAGDEFADDDCTSCPLDWAEAFRLYDDDDLDASVPDDPFGHIERHHWLDGVEAD